MVKLGYTVRTAVTSIIMRKSGLFNAKSHGRTASSHIAGAGYQLVSRRSSGLSEEGGERSMKQQDIQDESRCSDCSSGQNSNVLRSCLDYLCR